MSEEREWYGEQAINHDLHEQPHLFMRLAENALTVAESLRDNYFKNTSAFVGTLRRAMVEAEQGRREQILSVRGVADATWTEVRGEVVTFLDGGVGQVEIGSRVPILLRVGSYSVRVGERQLAQREQFGYYPVILGDLEGGSRDRSGFTDIVRISAELLGGLSALARTPDLNVLMFHGPLVYTMDTYAGHMPFTEGDIDLLLRHYAPDPALGRQLKEDFLREAALDIYPAMTARSDEWVARRLFEPVSWIAFLHRRLMETARQRRPMPIIAGVVERGSLRQFSEKVLLARVFRGLRAKGNANYFNRMYGRTDLTSPTALLDRLGYHDALLMALLLQPGEMSEPWAVTKYGGVREVTVSLPGEPIEESVNFASLRSPAIGFPRVAGCYVHVAPSTEPIRVEVYQDLGSEQLDAAARRAYLYARLLPGYGFPVGLDVVDKYARVPAWMTEAYGKMIRYQLGVSLQQGQVGDAEMQRLMVQAIYMNHRDWLFRPTV